MKKLFLTLALMCTLLCGAALSADAALYTPEECPQVKNTGTHRYEYISSLKDYGCYYCNIPCDHSDKLWLTEDNSWGSPYEIEEYKHYQRWQCKTCKKDGHDEKGEKCQWVISKPDPYSDEHEYKCKICNNIQKGKCTYTMVYEGYSDIYHTIEKKCVVCKGNRVINETSAKHTYKNNICTVCDFERIIPGKVKVSSIKSTKKGKKVTRTYPAHWDTWGSEVRWIPAKKYSQYYYEIKVNLKPAKDADHYVISEKKDPFGTNESGNRHPSKTTSFTYTYGSGSKRQNKVTLYITAISKTGTPGKTIKKVVKLKN